MSSFNSNIAGQLESFVRHRKAAGRWNDTYEHNLRLFDAHVARRFPDEASLTQEMVESWCAKRDTEGRDACRRRCFTIQALVRFLAARGLTDARGPNLPRAERSEYVPHDFTDEELAAFFAECDSYEPPTSLPEHLCIKLTLPVFFRLLYSSGLRTTEARLLRAEDVDLESGVLHIVVGKGRNERYVALHPSMAALMRDYDAGIGAIYPSRKYFFPQGAEGHRSTGWVSKRFKDIWSRISEERATAYELRHHYATVNINAIVGRGLDALDDLVYVSKSMGHWSVDSTARYYYSLVPAMSELLQDRCGKGLEDILPGVV